MTWWGPRQKPTVNSKQFFLSNQKYLAGCLKARIFTDKSLKKVAKKGLLKISIPYPLMTYKKREKFFEVFMGTPRI
jgi:hypothetical protein